MWIKGIPDKLDSDKKIPPMITLVSMVLVVGTLLIALKLGCGTQLSVLFGGMVAIIIALVLDTPLGDIIKHAVQCASDCAVAVTILLLVGVLVGIWLIGGSIPSLIYYGLKLISPKIIVPLSFVLCAVTSVCTGTSFGSLATMGLVLYGVGVSLGIPAPVIVGAVVSGAFFGDKMSPMSDTTNLAAAMSGVEIYSHIYSMLYTTVPATIVSLVLYTLIGFRYRSDSYNSSSIETLMTTLSSNYTINVWCILPMVLLLVLAVAKVHTILAMMITVVVSIIFAIVTQGATIADISATAFNGYVSATGVQAVDTILSRGGIISVMGSVTIVFFSALMTGALTSSGLMKELEIILLRFVHSVRSLIISTLVFAWSMTLMTGNQMLGIVIPGPTLAGLYEEKSVHAKVLSRSLEDSATIGAAIIPWSAAFAYISGVFGIGASYIPYALFRYIVPIFSILCAVTGIGVWDANGKRIKITR